MFERLESMLLRYNELANLIGNPEIIAKQEEWQKLVKEHSNMQNTIELFERYKKACIEITDCLEMLDMETDREMILLAKEELNANGKLKEKLIEELKFALLPKDPNDDKNVIIEIRGGAGGDEAALFAGVLQRMYMRFAERRRWKIKLIDINENELGGVKETVFMISGVNAYSKLKFESGVHRVQRVPSTESQGRVHTSTATVAVLPEIEEVEFEILEKDLKIDTYRSGGAGGQHVNKTESAIRITHLPTGLVVTCQDEKSQIKNKEQALKVLKSRLYDHYSSQINKEYSANRKLQVGSGDRSERIRTYNFPQGRVTDHRIGFTCYSLDNFVDGDIEEMLDMLAIESQQELLSSLENEKY